MITNMVEPLFERNQTRDDSLCKFHKHVNCSGNIIKPQGPAEVTPA